MMDTTKAVLGTLARTALKAAAGALVAHGWLNASGTEAFVGGGMIIASGAWSFYNDYGRAMAIDALDILRAKVANAARAARENKVSPQSALARLDQHVAETAPVPKPIV
jgi:uncharacterized membrane protein